MTGTFWALVPPIVAIVLALITKETYSSLFVGILVGALFVGGFNPVASLDTMLNDGFLGAIADGNVIMAERMVQTGSEFHEFRERFIELMRLSYQHDLAKLKLWSEAIAEMKREKARRFLDYAVRQVRENFIYNLHNPELNYLTREEEAFSTRFSPFINERNVEGIAGELQRASADIAGNGNAKLILFDLTIRLAILIRK